MSSVKKQPIVAIVGRTNVGKSSIFNVILNRREAIVAREEGTTRDSVMALSSYNSHSFWLVDTAGLKTAEDDFEATIQEQILQAVDSADVIWLVIEAKTIITHEDRELATKILKSKKPVFLIVNKVDQVKSATVDNYRGLGIKDIFLVSASQHKGFEELLGSLTKLIPKVTTRPSDKKIRLAIIGRPNVGKSQLFNTLLNKQQAIVSDRAGTTRDVNRKTVKYENKEIELLDTAGIRRSGKIQRGVEHFSVLRTLAAIEDSDICVLVMDVNELNVVLDQKIAGMVKDADKGLILVVSKWDSLSEKTPYTHDQMVAQIKQNYDFVPWSALVFTSSITGQNVTKLLPMSLEIMDERSKHIKTHDLNRWLEDTTAKHPPAGLKHFMPKLNYIVQESDNPSPTFKIYGSRTKFLHWSYKRFMEHELRSRFGFEGTAIRFWFFDKIPTTKPSAKVRGRV